MPLNISIDVDGTILDANEKLFPHVRESLQLLKDAGHCLQLWSAGGADYAYKHALKNKLTDLFESYAKKSDVAIDDLPETAHPLAVVHVDHNHTLDQAVKKVLSIEQNVDAALTLNSKLVSYVKEFQNETDAFKTTYQIIRNNKIAVHPIPFFGVIENAKIITIGLNPSVTEFTEVGRWSEPLTACELTQRLVNYFRLPDLAPHYWFAELQWSLEILHCSYNFAAAHVDASPWTTHAPSRLKSKQQKDLYDKLLMDGIQKYLPRTFEFCKNTVELVAIIYSSHAEAKRVPIIKEIIARSIGRLRKNNVEIIVISKNHFPRWAWENRERLKHILGTENIF
jgi:hypothetical protein